MAAFNIHLYEDTRELLELYNHNIAFKNSFQRLLNRGGVSYKGRLLKTYVKLIAFIDPQYNKYLQSSFDIDGIDELFDHFYNKNTESFHKLEESIKTQTPLMPLEIEEEIAEIEALPDGEEKQKKWLEHEDKKEQNQEQIQIPRQVTEQIEELVQEESSPASQPSILDEPEAPSGEPSGSAESAPQQPNKRGGGGGNRLAEELEDRAAKRLAGAARGAGRNLARGAGRLAVQGGARLGALALAGTGGTGAAVVIVAVILIAVFVAIFLPMFQQQQKDEALLMKGVAHAAPIISGSGDINSCSFTRAGVSKPIGSVKLKTIFQEVSAKSGVPASVLASVAVHENSDFPINAPDSHDAFSDIGFGGVECRPHFPTSPTGALGLMQIQPPIRILPRARPDAYSEDGVRKGAQMARRTLESLTMQDFCNVRMSVFLGAGVLIAKNGGQPPVTPDQVETAVCGYFGSPCSYQGSFHYGKEARADFLKCRVSSSPTYNPGGGTGIVSCPVNGGRSYHGSKGKGGHCDPKTYKFQCTPPGQPGYTGRETAVDIQGSDKNVSLPNLGGGSVQWTIVEDPTRGGDIKDSEGGGKAITAQASYNGHIYRIRLVHLISSTLNVGDKANSGKYVGQYNGNANHVHITLQEDGVYKPADLYFNLCQ